MNQQPHKVAKLFEPLISDSERAEGWKNIYIDFVLDVKKLQRAIAKHPKLAIDNKKLYTTLSAPIRSYESFMMKWLRDHRNGIASRGQSVLSGEHFRTIIADPVFKRISKDVIKNPTPKTYQLLMDWWYGNEEISNRPLLINRAFAACFPEKLSSTVDIKKFQYVVNFLQSYGFNLDENKEWNWFSANVELTKWLDVQLKNVIGKVSNDALEQQIWRNIFVWLIYASNQGKQLIPENKLIRRDLPEDGHTEMPLSATNFEGRDVDFEGEAKIQKELGDAGEELVKLHEIEELEKWKMFEKAKLVRIAKPGEGYDVYSFDEKGDEKFIEVKTTNGSWKNRFFLTRHEIKFMRERKSNYSLYRIYNFDEENNSGEFFELQGNIEERIIMQPIQFEVVIKKR